MKLAPGPHRKRTTEAISSGSALKPSGILELGAGRTATSSPRTSEVLVAPGATQLMARVRVEHQQVDAAEMGDDVVDHFVNGRPFGNIGDER